MKLYNTVSRQLEQFSPEGNRVTIYVCGITPYDTTHLGHAFTYTINDVLIRYLESRGYEVVYAQNVTDIDDDILKRAGRVGEDWRQLGDRWTAHFIRDLQTLNVRPPDYYPRATGVIPDIVKVVQQLLAAGVAYERGGNVYFSIEAWPEYGKLSCLSHQEMLPIANERGNKPDDVNKKDPLDFVLWQAQAPGEPAWESPWGPGRPGWHIECSTMATNLLGETVDIHSGGADLLFPHHESEIAQVEPITGSKSFVRFWLHVAMVRHEGEKMSKSLGNLVMVRELLKTYSPDALRLFLGAYHYRYAWEYDEARLRESEMLAEKLRLALRASAGEAAPLNPQAWQGSFQAAMDNDLDTGAALSAMSALAEEIIACAGEGYGVRAAQDTLRLMGKVFGLRLDAEGPEERVISGWNKHLVNFEN